MLISSRKLFLSPDTEKWMFVVFNRKRLIVSNFHCRHMIQPYRTPYFLMFGQKKLTSAENITNFVFSWKINGQSKHTCPYIFHWQRYIINSIIYTYNDVTKIFLFSVFFFLYIYETSFIIPWAFAFRFF